MLGTTLQPGAGRRQTPTGVLHPESVDSDRFDAPLRPWFSTPEGVRPSLPDYAQLVEIGQELLGRLYGLSGAPMPCSPEGALLNRGDREWVRKRLKRLAPMAEKRIRIIPKGVWDIAMLCMHPRFGVECIKHFGRRVPTDFLAAGCAVAMLKYDAQGQPVMRAVDSRRAQSILTLTIVLWLLARRVKGKSHFGYEITGLPYGAFCELLARFENFGRAQRRAPHVNTLWGTHRVGGRFDRAELGYLAAMRQAGMLRTKQPPWHVVEPNRRGRPRTNANGDFECWAFVEITLRIPTPGEEAPELGPPPIWMHPPEPDPRPAQAQPPADARVSAPVPELEIKRALDVPLPAQPLTRPIQGPAHEGISMEDALSEWQDSDDEQSQEAAAAMAKLSALMSKGRKPTRH